MAGVRVEGATVLVTGASSGIGRAAALRLAERGATVIGVGLDGAALEALARHTGGSAMEVDVRDPGHVPAVLDHVRHTHGRLDAVVLNAGVGHAGDFIAMAPERVDDLLDINLRAPMLLARGVAPLLVEQGAGSLLFVSSIAGCVPVRYEAAYSATKAGVESFAEALRMELRPTGVTVSVVRPGVVRTPFHEQRDLPYTRRWPRLMPPDRIGEVIVAVLESGAATRTEPRWLEVAARVRGVSPGLFRRLSARLG